MFYWCIPCGITQRIYYGSVWVTGGLILCSVNQSILSHCALYQLLLLVCEVWDNFLFAYTLSCTFSLKCRIAVTLSIKFKICAWCCHDFLTLISMFCHWTRVVKLVLSVCIPLCKQLICMFDCITLIHAKSTAARSERPASCLHNEWKSHNSPETWLQQRLGCVMWQSTAIIILTA